MLRFLRRLTPGVRNPAPIIPVIRFDGVISGGDPLGRGLSLARVEMAMARAFDDRDAPCVAAVVNSPGGSPVQARMIHDRLRALSEEKSKPVFVFCEDLAASGGYMIACAGDEIFADLSSLVGSIGVVGAMFGFPEAMARLGVERRVYTAGKNKVRLDPFRPESEDDVAFVRRVQQAIHQDFIDLVRTRRRDRLDPAADVFEGDVWTGREALALGLIDGVGHIREVLREKYGDKVRMRRIPIAKPSIGRRLLGAGAGAAIEAIEHRAHWARYGL